MFVTFMWPPVRPPGSRVVLGNETVHESLPCFVNSDSVTADPLEVRDAACAIGTIEEQSRRTDAAARNTLLTVALMAKG